MKTGNPNNPKRRDFLQQLAFCCVAMQLPLSFIGCREESAKKFIGSGKAPFKVWEEMLMALKTSPDHLKARMESLIALGDPKAMFHFVRDEINLMPASNRSLGRIGTQLKWGIRGVLRYGLATPREKAELLNLMYTRAGFSSEVVYEQTSINPEEAITFFLRPLLRRFDLQVTDEQWKDWEKEIQTEGGQGFEISEYDPGFIKTNTLADQLWEHIPNKDQLKNFKFDLRWDNQRTPTVKLKYKGKTYFAHLFDPKIDFGNLKNDNGGITKKAEIPTDNKEKVQITVSYREALEPNREKNLVSGEWLSSKLVGNQINMSFLSGLTIEQQQLTSLESLRTFTPVLAFQSFNEERTVLEENSYLGNPFTLDGKTIEISGSTTTINGNHILSKVNAELQKKIVKLRIKAIPVDYPLVKLHVTPTDINGEFVEGLAASDFYIRDNNLPVGALMETNRPTPRILLLYDTSSSMPRNYYKKNMDLFTDQIEKTLLEKYPAADIKKWPTPSKLFTYLLRASKSDCDLILYVTDGDTLDTYNEKNEKIYRSGPPALILNAHSTELEFRVDIFNKMAEITNGQVLKANDQSKTLEAVKRYIENLDVPPYIFTYYTSGANENHKVELGVDHGRLTADDSYKFLDLNQMDGTLGQTLIGLYCTIMIDKKKYRRVLAGWDPIIERNIHPDKSHVNDVRNTILGGATLYIEGEGPTPSAALSDLLKYKLTTRSWGEALLENDYAKAKAAFNQEGYKFHPQVLPLMAPLEDAITSTSLTFASGLRMAIIKHKIGVGDNFISTSFDYLPTSKYVTISISETPAFQINLKKTAQLAIREAHYFDNNTMEQLNCAELIERKLALATHWFKHNTLNRSDHNYWRERIDRGDGHYKIFDKTARSLAYWQIREDTGEMYGILPDHTGGGTRDIEWELKRFNQCLDLYIAMFSVAGVMSPPLGIVAAYGKTLVKLYAIVCETLIVMDAEGMDDKIAAALQVLACNIHKEIYFGATGKAGELMGGLDFLIAQMGDGSGLFKC